MFLFIFRSTMRNLRKIEKKKLKNKKKWSTKESNHNYEQLDRVLPSSIHNGFNSIVNQRIELTMT